MAHNYLGEWNSCRWLHRKLNSIFIRNEHTEFAVKKTSILARFWSIAMNNLELVICNQVHEEYLTSWISEWCIAVVLIWKRMPLEWRKTISNYRVILRIEAFEVLNKSVQRLVAIFFISKCCTSKIAINRHIDE